MSWLFNQDDVEQWAYWEDVFCPKDCDRLIEIAKSKNKMIEGVVVSSKNKVIEDKLELDITTEVDKVIRKSNVTWLSPHDDELFGYMKRLTEVVTDLNKRFFNFDLYGFTEDLQFTEYKSPGGHYDFHTDTMYKGYVRKLSISLQLTDDTKYKGGNLIINTGGSPQYMKRKQGTVTVFPSYVLHKVEPVTKGTRHALIGWVSGPNFK